MQLVADVCDYIAQYRRAIFGSLLSYKKDPSSPLPPEEDLSVKLAVVGDTPAAVLLDELLDVSKPLCAVISLLEGGEVRIGGQYGFRTSNRKVPLFIDLWCANAGLRESMGEELYAFFSLNPGLLVGIRSPWACDTIQSKGHLSAPEKIYRRSYTLWVIEHLSI